LIRFQLLDEFTRRQENRFEASENGTVVPDDKETIKRIASDPMFKLDRGDEDVTKAKKAAHPRINKIAEIQGRCNFLSGRPCDSKEAYIFIFR